MDFPYASTTAEIEAEEELTALEHLRAAAAQLDIACWVRAHPFESVLGALAAGFIVGNSPKTAESLAKTLLQFLR